MSLYYITGVPGSGKSTIQNRLVELGYEAYDIDESRFGGPVNLKTGESTIVPPLAERTPEWFSAHEWRVSRTAIVELAKEATKKDIFLCGTATTENLVWDLFDKIFYLDLDEETLRHRIAIREDNDFGKSDHELQLIIERYKISQSSKNDRDMIIINATDPVDKIIEKIIQKINIQ